MEKTKAIVGTVPRYGRLSVPSWIGGEQGLKRPRDLA